MANQAIIKGTKITIGDQVKVHQKVKEKDKERIQTFTGTLISIKGEQDNKTFTVRKIATGHIGVERIWPAISPWITKIEVIKHGKARRAKLYYLRKRIGKKATRIKTKKKKEKEENNNKEENKKKSK